MRSSFTSYDTQYLMNDTRFSDEVEVKVFIFLLPSPLDQGNRACTQRLRVLSASAGCCRYQKTPTRSARSISLIPRLLDPIFFHPIDERRPRDIKVLRRAGLIALVPFERPDDEVLLQVFKRDPFIGKVQDNVLNACFFFPELIRQFGGRYRVSPLEHRGPLDGVLKLADIPRPAVGP